MSEAARIRSLIDPDKRVVFVSGNFNVLHPGHVRLLRFAREQGDCLVVGVNPNDHPGVGADGALRLEGVRSNRDVSHAFLIDQPVEQVIRTLRPAVVVKGREHENMANAEVAPLAEIGGKLVFSSGEMLRSSFSSLEEDGSPPALLPPDYLARHGINAGGLASVLESFAGLRVIVIGDMIVDDYIDCDPLGMSQEDPTIVVTPIDQRRFMGGAGIVAAHGRGLGARVTLISAVGEDDVAAEAEARLAEYGVGAVLLRDASRPTTLKQRYRAAGKTLLRVSHLRQHAVSRELSQRIVDEVRARIEDTDLILFSDFNYGCLPTGLVEDLAILARDANVLMGADSQASSQISDISRFRGMRLITPTELEARLALNDRVSNLAVLSEELLRKAEAEHIIMTLGADGVLVRSRAGLATDRIGALNARPRDVAGAGDSLFCTAALSIAVGSDIWQAALLGSVAAACQVGRVGNIPLARGEIARAIAEGHL